MTSLRIADRTGAICADNVDDRGKGKDPVVDCRQRTGAPSDSRSAKRNSAATERLSTRRAI
jgi:hypothetical protein